MRASVFGLIWIAASAGWAQSGGLVVVVSGEAGEALPGATVTLGHDMGYLKPTAQLTDAAGAADFPVLRPGPGYRIEVGFPGLATVRRDALRVEIDRVQTVLVQLTSELQERVRVVAQSETVDIEQSHQATRFDEDFIADLPVPGRFYQNVLTMAPGVQDADGDGNPNVHGSRSRDFQAIVGNVSNVDPLTGQWMSRVNPNSIEEMEVITAGAGVEFGRAQGGFARIIQKQGTNTHEGVAEFYYRSSELDGVGAFDGTAFADPEFDWYQPALQLSGPIVRDRLWYRVSLERRDIEEPVVTGALQIVTTEERTNDAQLTWQASPRNKLALQYRQDPRRVENIGVSTLVDESASHSLDRESQVTSLTWTAPHSPRVLVESTLSWQDLKESTFPTSPGLVNDCVGVSGFLAAAQCFDGGTGRVSGSYNVVRSDHRQRLSVKGHAIVHGGQLWGASHRLKLGFQTEGERYFRDQTQGPQIVYTVIPRIQQDPLGSILADVAVPASDDVRATGQNWALYLEDQLKPRQNVTVTLGARVDREEISSEGRQRFDPRAELAQYLADIRPYVDPFQVTFDPDSTLITDAQNRAFTGYEDYPSFEHEIIALLCEPGLAFEPCAARLKLELLADQQGQARLQHRRRQQDIEIVNTNFSPYLSVAWDPFSDGKMALKAAAGRHYSLIPLIVPLQELHPARTTLAYQVELGGPNAGALSLTSDISPTVNVVVLDPELRTPYQDELALSFERELWNETSLSLTWIDRRYRDQLQDRNINVGTADYGVCWRPESSDDPVLVENWGTGLQLRDPYSGRYYFDTESGPGDGIPDDCQGGTNRNGLTRPDGIPDLYRQNPFWGDIYEIGNFNQIDYQAIVAELVRRQYRGWELQGSYTYSRAQGDGEDFTQQFDDDPSVLPEDRRGDQSYDQRHVAKLNATTVTPWGLRLGTAVTWQSGLPYSLLVRRNSFDTLPPATANSGVAGARSRLIYVTGERNDQRNISYWNVDLRVTKELTLGRDVNLQLAVEVYNVLDEGTYQIYNPDLERGVQINGANEARRRFGRQWQLGFKLAF